MNLRRWLLAALLLTATAAQALDRGAFTFTQYRLTLNILPDRSGMDVLGSVTLRNDSKQPQSSAVLQISSALEWRAIRVNGEPAAFLAQDYRSDIDHTGLVREAIVTLDEPVAPGQSVTLELHYAGNVPQDSSRLTRLGAPGKAAARSEWDQVSPEFTAFRGLGYLLWYPVAMESQTLAGGAKFFAALEEWKLRHHGVILTLVNGSRLVPEGDSHSNQIAAGNGIAESCAVKDCPVGYALDGPDPVIALGAYEKLSLGPATVWHTGDQMQRARDYATAAGSAAAQLEPWFGAPKDPLLIVALSDEHALPYEAGNVLLTPLRQQSQRELELALAPLAARAAFHSPRAWLTQGVEGFAQALVRENLENRHAALAQMNLLTDALAATEYPPVAAKNPPQEADSSSSKPSADAENPETAPTPAAVPQAPLLYSTDQLVLRAKGAFVLWMLRDLAGDEAMRQALRGYDPQADTGRDYLESLLSAASHRDLSAFFGDWVYNDRGLARLRLLSAYVHKSVGKSETQPSWVVTLTAENQGECWVETPLSVRYEQGERSERLVLPPHQKGVLRIVSAQEPKDALVNDGSIPEPDVEQHIIKIKGESN